MLREVAAGIALAILMGLTGCASMDRSVCRAVTIGSGALLGATAGGLISGVGADYASDVSDGSRNWIIGASTGGGAVVGSLVGWGLSEAVCKEPPPPPPPPPAPARIAPPPPPPPPPTERRGG